MTFCKWCEEDVDIPFEETRDKKGRLYLKGPCPKCGRINKDWPRKTSEDIPPDESVINNLDIPPEEPPEEPPEDPEEEAIHPEEQELITEEEEKKEEEKPTNWKDIALMICVAVIIIQIIVLVWLTTTKKEDKHGQKTD